MYLRTQELPTTVRLDQPASAKISRTVHLPIRTSSCPFPLRKSQHLWGAMAASQAHEWHACTTNEKWQPVCPRFVKNCSIENEPSYIE